MTCIGKPFDCVLTGQTSDLRLSKSRRRQRAQRGLSREDFPRNRPSIAMGRDVVDSAH